MGKNRTIAFGAMPIVALIVWALAGCSGPARSTDVGNPSEDEATEIKASSYVSHGFLFTFENEVTIRITGADVLEFQDGGMRANVAFEPVSVTIGDVDALVAYANAQIGAGFFADAAAIPAASRLASAGQVETVYLNELTNGIARVLAPEAFVMTVELAPSASAAECVGEGCGRGAKQYTRILQTKKCLGAPCDELTEVPGGTEGEPPPRIPIRTPHEIGAPLREVPWENWP